MAWLGFYIYNCPNSYAATGNRTHVSRVALAEPFEGRSTDWATRPRLHNCKSQNMFRVVSYFLCSLNQCQRVNRVARGDVPDLIPPLRKRAPRYFYRRKNTNDVGGETNPWPFHQALHSGHHQKKYRGFPRPMTSFKNPLQNKNSRWQEKVEVRTTWSADKQTSRENDFLNNPSVKNTLNLTCLWEPPLQ